MPTPGAYAAGSLISSAAGAPYRRYADAILGGRYGFGGLDESLLFPAAGAPYPNPASAAVPAYLQGSGDTTTELLRLRDAHSRVLTNEVAARALQDQVSAAQQQQQNNQQALQYQASAQQQQATAQRNHDLNLANSIERIMAQQEAQVQEHRLREQLVGKHHQQAVARAAWGGGAGGLGLGGINLLASRAAALSGDGSSYANNLQLADAEAVALRERFAHRRALEEEAMRLQHNNHQLHQQLLQPSQHVGAGAGSSGDAAEQQHHLQQNGGISHLLQIQHMSDEELIRLRDGLGLGVGSRVGAGIPSIDSLFERQLMDAHILLNGGGIGGVGAGLSRFQQSGGVREALAALARLPDRAGGDEALINQAYLDAAIARRAESVRLGGQQPAVDNGNDGIHHRQAAMAAMGSAISAAYPPSVGGGGSGQPLRYFNNGKEVDMEGNPLPPSNDNNSGNGDGGGACGNGDSVIPSNRLPGHPLDGNANAPVVNNAITRFLYAVVNRVPEIGPALSVLQREGNEPGRIAREFPNVVDATMTVLRSIQERCARATDEITLDLHRRITGWYVDSLFVIHLLFSLV